MPIKTEDLTKLGKVLGATPPAAKLVVRYNLATQKVSKGFTFLHFTETPATTPTGGRYVRRTIVVRRKSDGKKFIGNLRKDHKGYSPVNVKPYVDPRS